MKPNGTAFNVRHFERQVEFNQLNKFVEYILGKKEQCLKEQRSTHQVKGMGCSYLVLSFFKHTEHVSPKK